MKKVSIFNFLIAFYFCITPFNSIGSEDFDVGIYDATFSVIEELKNKNQLENRRLAVYGFRNSKTDQGCKQLSYVLANKIIDSISKLKRILDISFSVVSRSDLEALETELGLFNKLGNYRDISSYLENSDILITGTWSDMADEFVFDLKAFEIDHGKFRIVTSQQKKIYKSGLDESILICLSDGLALPSIINPENDCVEIISYIIEDKSNTQEKEIRVNVKMKKHTGNDVDRSSLRYRENQYGDNEYLVKDHISQTCTECYFRKLFQDQKHVSESEADRFGNELIRYRTLYMEYYNKKGILIKSEKQIVGGGAGDINSYKFPYYSHLTFKIRLFN